MTDNKGWECPKCGNCYSPMIYECSRCNSNIKIDSTLSTFIPTPIVNELKDIGINTDEYQHSGNLNECNHKPTHVCNNCLTIR